MPGAPPVKRKLVIVGDGACGKTSLLSVFAMGEFPKHYEPTIFENYVAEIMLDGKPVQLALWDTAGQEEYERLRPLSYAQSHVILIAFSIDTPDSLDNVITKWIEEVRSICGRSIPVLLVGCKRDLRDTYQGSDRDAKFVSTAQAQQVANNIGARTYKECSALENSGVDEIFEAATRSAMLVRGANPTNTGRRGDSSGMLENEKRGKRSSIGAGGESTSSKCCVII